MVFWMDGRVDSWMNPWIDDGWMDVWMDGLNSGYGYGYLYGYVSTLQLIQLLLKQSSLHLQQDLHWLLLQLLQHMLLLQQIHC